MHHASGNQQVLRGAMVCCWLTESMLLRAVENGEQFTITVRGKPIADLVPHRSQSAHSLKAAVHAMQAFPRIQSVADADVASFVSEGRR